MNLRIYMKCGKCKRYTLPCFDEVSATSTTSLDMRNWLEMANQCPSCRSTQWQLCIEPVHVEQVVEAAQP
jgi:hypothetical protein